MAFLFQFQKKCDAVRPSCTTCRIAGREDCDYASGPIDKRRFETDNEGDLYPIELDVEYSIESNESLIAENPAESATLMPVIRTSVSPPSDFFDPAMFPSSSTSAHFPSNIVQNPPPLLLDVDDPYAFALSNVSLDDLNLRL